MHIRFLAAVRVEAARCKLPVALRPGLSPEDREYTKEVAGEGLPPVSLLLFRRGHEGVRGEKERSILLLSTRLLSLQPPLLSSPLPPLPEFSL